MEDLLKKQSLIGKEIEKSYRNFKKDSQERKTEVYLKTRLDQLEEWVLEFDKNDDELSPHEKDSGTHPYFKNNYFSEITTVHTLFRSMIDKALNDIRNKQASNNEDETEPFQVNLNEADKAELTKKIKGQKRRMEVLTRKLREIESQGQQAHSQAYVNVKLQTIQKEWADIRENDRDIWESSDDSPPLAYTTDTYTELENLVQEMLVKLSETAGTNNSNQTNGASQVKLPKINLPTFDGSYIKWTHFHDLYVQLIHSQNIGNAQKMYYLTSHLNGEAERLIHHLPVSDSNYITAWNILKSRYDNKRLLCTSFLHKLLNQPTINLESAQAVRSIHDITNECILGLKNLGIPVQTWDAILIHLIIKKLDKITHSLYEQSLESPRELPTMKQFLNFLETRFQSLEALGKEKPTGSSERKFIRTDTKQPRLSTFMTVSKTIVCIACKKEHQLYICREFLAKSITERFHFVKKHKLCINCLRSGHTSSNCSSRSCPKCNKRHNSLLHRDNSNEFKSSSTSRVHEPSTSVTQSHQQSSRTVADITTVGEEQTTLAARSTRFYVLLGTVEVDLIDNMGNTITCRAVLDSGSQINFISDRMARKLNLHRIPDSMLINGIGESAQHAQHRINVEVRSRVTGFAINLETFILSKITSYQPSFPINVDSWSIPKNIKLADPSFNRPGAVDLLIGAEVYYELLAIGQINLGNDLPTVQNSVFGWVFTGRIPRNEISQVTCGISNEVETIQALENFWKLEEVDSSDETKSSTLTLSEQKCVNHFQQHVKRNEQGQFIVRLPFLHNPDQLGDSRFLAIKRMESLERRFARHPEIKAKYVEFINEYIQLGHMHEISFAEIPKSHYFLPHHCVVKPDSTTTALRVVFDGSAKTKTNISLNDILCKGPTIQEQLFTILLRFRFPRFVFTADIEKMYRQILLSDEDQQYQLIVWRENQNQPMKIFKLCTVTYGLTTAPFLAVKSLHHLADQNSRQYPLGCQTLKRDFYVDDVMTGSDSLSQAIDIRTELKTVLHSAGFNLRKWCGNHPRLLEGLPKADIELEVDFDKNDEGHIKTLGLKWLPNADTFFISTSHTNHNHVTKRTMLSDIAKIFDPLGFMTPVTITAKIFIQKLWLLKLDWDAAVPMNVHSDWTKFKRGLESVNNIRIPRHVYSNKIPHSVQTHSFSDASERAYGAVVYIRAIYKDSTISVRLLCAKSKVAPLKSTSIPRLELCAAKLSALLVNRLLTDLTIQNLKVYYWTDSKVVLSWINSESSSYQVFVANRIASIQRLSNIEQWRYVNTKENPADIASRGLQPEKLEQNNFWFYGPIFLHGLENTWPHQQQ